MNPLEIIYTIGCPGSGKTTWAQRYVDENWKYNGRVVDINRDTIRDKLDPTTKNHFSDDFEQLVNEKSTELVKLAAYNDSVVTIIMSDTNLDEHCRSEHQKLVSSITSRPITITEVPFDVPYNELIKRNLKRGHKSVPIPVLRSFYIKMEQYLGRLRLYEPDTSLPKAIIVDLDGTLANHKHRGPFEFEKIPTDVVNTHVSNAIELYKANGYAIICVSGRNSGDKLDDNKWRLLTENWLNDNNISWDELWMRSPEDYRRDDLVKEELFFNEIAGRYNVELSFDDRDQVVEMWRRINVPCFQVGFGEF